MYDIIIIGGGASGLFGQHTQRYLIINFSGDKQKTVLKYQ